MASVDLEYNQGFKIYKGNTWFNNLVLHKATYETVVMSLGDKISGIVYYKNNKLVVDMTEYIMYKDVKYVLVNPPTVIKEGLVSDNGELKGMTKYSFTFYHPMYMLSNFPFSDVAVDDSQKQYLSQNKTFSWIGNLVDYKDKLNKNLEGTQWKVSIGTNVTDAEKNKLSEVLSFDNNTIADALKTAYETWEIPYIVDKVEAGTQDYLINRKRFVVQFGLPSDKIYEKDKNGKFVLDDNNQKIPFVFKYGQGVGLKNNSRTPKNNKIVTRIAGYGSEDNIPYGYPQIVWTGNQNWNYTINNDSTAANSYPIYDGIVGGQKVRLIKHPFTRTHLMPPIYKETVNKKVNPNATGYNPNTELIDYYDANGNTYPNQIKAGEPSYEIHEFEDIKPEFGSFSIYSATPYDGHSDESISQDKFLSIVDDLYTETDIKAEKTQLNALRTFFVTQQQYNAKGTSGNYEYDWSFKTDGIYKKVKYTSSGANFEYVVKVGLTPATIDWDDTMDEQGNYVQSYFKVTIPKLGFDLYASAAITQEMTINMRSGACIGCSFPVMVDWDDYKRNFYDKDGNFAPTGTQRNLTKYPNSTNSSITLILQKETNTFGTLMPNIYQKPASGDKFVILGISLPTSYITTAEGKLETEMKKYMRDNNVYYYEYPLKFDEHFLISNEHILSQMKPNVIVNFEYADVEQSLYIKQMSIKYNESPLPKYDITLTDDVDVVLNKIGEAIAEYRGQRQYENGGGNSETLDGNKFLRKDINDTASGTIRVLKGLQVGERFVTGLLGEGGIFRKDDDGTTYLECDRMYVRMKAYFDTVEVRRFLHSGGNRIASAAGIKCSRVEYIASNGLATQNVSNAVKFRCYFRAQDNGVSITNDFEIGDQAYCKETNANLGQHSYWRLVIGTSSNPINGEHYIDLSNYMQNGQPASMQLVDSKGVTHYHPSHLAGSDAPIAQDDIIQLGHAYDKTRQGAIVEYVSGEDAPSYQIYQGINTYDLNNKNYIGLGYSSEKGRAYMNVYGDMFVGVKPDAITGKSPTYIKYVQDDGTEQHNPKLIIKGIVEMLSPDDQEETTTLDDFAKAITGDIEYLQQQIDGEIDTWFYDGEPALNKYPASEWTTDTEKKEHLGDLYYDKLNGNAYRFIYDKDNETYSWLLLSDSAILEALRIANEAKDTADNKRRVFLTDAQHPHPTPPYDEGDLWVNAVWPYEGQDIGSTYNDEFLKCTVAKVAGQGFAISDWSRTSTHAENVLQDFIEGTFETTIKNIKNQVDHKVQTWYQAINPADFWEEPYDVRSEHVGDLWYCTKDTTDKEGNNFKKDTTWQYVDNGEGVQPRYQWKQQNVPEEIFDKIDGKRAIYSEWGGWMTGKDHQFNQLQEEDLFIPQEDTTPYDVTFKANKVYRCTNAFGELIEWPEDSGTWVRVPRFQEIAYTDDSAFDGYINAILNGTGSSGDAATVAAAQKAIKEALGNGTLHEGGLVLTSLIGMRDKQNKVWAGINGQYQPAESGTGYKGHGIAAWYGGGMADWEVYKESHPTATINDTYAKSLFRFDGSGYLAGGNITWDAQGRVAIKDITTLVGGNDTDILNALTTFNKAFHFTTQQGDTSTILNINPQYAFSHLEIYDVNGNHAVATTDYVNENFVTKAFFNRLFQAYSSTITTDANKVSPNEATAINNLKILVGAWTDQYLSAKGINPQQSGGGGVGDVTWDLLESSSDTHQIAASHLNVLSGYATQSWVTQQIASSAIGNRLAQYALADGASVGSFTHTSDLIYTAKGGGNGCTDKPDGIDSFGLISLKTAGGYYGQMLLSAIGRLYLRSSNSIEGATWNTVAFTSDLSAYTKTTSMKSLTIKGGTTSVVVYNPTDASATTVTINAGTGMTVTGAANEITITRNTLQASDIPNLDWAKITTGKPTSLAGYGISASDALFADITAGKATKLQTARNLWGKSFDGTADVSGGITLEGILVLWEGSSHAHDFTISWSEDVAQMYAYEGQYYDLCIGTATGAVSYGGGLYYDASEKSWGIGTMAPAVKLHVNGDSYTSGKIYLYKDASNSDNDLYFERDGNSVKLHGDFYATGAVSALGSNSSSGGAVDMDTVWTALATNDTSHKIDNSHLTLGTLTINGTTYNPTNTAGVTMTLATDRLGQYTIQGLDRLSSFIHATDLIYMAAGGNNNIDDKPDNVTAFGVLSYKVADGYYGQILHGANGKLYYRQSNNLSGGWNTVVISSDLDNYLLSSDISAWAKASAKPTYTWEEITSKPSTFTPPVASSSVRGGIKVGETLAISDEVLNLATVTVGTPVSGDITYTKICVDAYGRVTAGTNPTTLDGYGITDAVKDNTTWWGQTINKATTPNSVSGDITVGEGSIFLNKGRSIYAKDSINNRVLMRLGTDNVLIIGSGAAEAGYNTYYYGKNLYFKYGTATATGMILDDKGNVGIGTTTPAVKLDVNGDIRTATGDGAYIQIGDIRIGYDYDNTALEVYKVDNEGNHISANLYARGAVSALGSENSSGSVFDESQMWDALGGSMQNQKIANSHLNLFSLSITTQNGTVTYNPSTGSQSVDLSNMTGDYLPLTGGTLTLSSIDGFVIKRPDSQYGYIKFVGNVENVADTVMGWLGVNGVDNPVFRNTAGNVYKLWHEGNNGHGGGIDADKLDGQHGSYYATASSVTTLEGYFTNGVANQAVNLNVRDMAVGDDYDTLSGYTAARGSFVAVNIDGRTSSEVTLDGLGAYDTLASFGYNLRTIQLKGSAYDSTLKYRHVVQPSSGVYSFSAWKTIAFTDSSITGNAATATKLYDESAFTAWGATFFTGGKPTSISNTGLAGVDGIDFYGSNGVKMDTNGNIVHKTNTSGNYWHVDTKAGVAVLSVTAGGDVGIGTVSPATKLEVDGTIRTSGNLDLLRNGSGIRFYLDSSNNYVVGLRMLTGSNNLILGDGTSTKSYDTSIYGYNVGLYYGTSHNTGILVNSSGNVSVGSSVDSFITEKLNVNGNIKTSASNGSYIQIGDIRIVYDNTDNRNALKVVGSDGTSAANFYATGAVSALGSNTTQGDVDYAYGLTYDSSTGDLTLVENGQNKTVKIESGTNMGAVWTALATETSTNVQQIHPSHMAFADSRYLKLSGGTLTASTGNTPLTIKSGSTVADIKYCDKNDTILGYIGVSSDNKPYFKNGTSSYDILHTGNFKVGDHLSFSNSTLDLESGIVAAGTYRSVTVDTYGRVTAGTNPTTLSGYGITDALSNTGGTISGNLTVTGSITSNNGLYVVDSAGVHDLSMLWVKYNNVDYFGIYAYENKYWNLCIGAYPNAANKPLVFDGTNQRWGVGTYSPAYRLDVSGNIRATETSWFPSLELYASAPYIDFHKGMTTPADTPDYTTRLIESSAGILSLLAKDSNNVEKIAGLVIGNSNTGDYIKIGGAKLRWTGTALECDKDFYSTGAVSALGSGSSGGGSQIELTGLLAAMYGKDMPSGSGALYYSDGSWSFQPISGGTSGDYIPLSGSRYITGDLTPQNYNSTQNTGCDLGNDSKRWRQIWGRNFIGETIKLLEDKNEINFRGTQHDNFGCKVGYRTYGDEALVFANKNSNTSFMFYTGRDLQEDTSWYWSVPEQESWNYELPAMQIRRNSVYINSLVTGDTEPQHTLHVNGTGFFENAVVIQKGGIAIQNGTIGAIAPDGSAHQLVGKTEIYGNVGIGTTSSSTLKLDVNGVAQVTELRLSHGFYIDWDNSNANAYTIGEEGRDIYIEGDWHGKWASSSDVRLKDIDQYLDGKIEDIALAPIFSFRWKNKPNKPLELGTSAQYWKVHLSYGVTQTHSGYLALDYGATALAAAVFTARKVVDHELRIKQLEERIYELEQEINELKAA